MTGSTPSASVARTAHSRSLLSSGLVGDTVTDVISGEVLGTVTDASATTGSLKPSVTVTTARKVSPPSTYTPSTVARLSKETLCTPSKYQVMVWVRTSPLASLAEVSNRSVSASPAAGVAGSMRRVGATGGRFPSTTLAVAGALLSTPSEAVTDTSQVSPSAVSSGATELVVAASTTTPFCVHT